MLINSSFLEFIPRILLATLFLLAPVLVFAQEMGVQTAPDSTEPVSEIENMSVHSAVLLDQTDTSFSVSFSLQNLDSEASVQLQSEVSLVNIENSRVEFLAAEVTGLAANETNEKIVSYPLIDVPIGSYLVTVTTKGISGRLLGESIAGTLQITKGPAALAAHTHPHPDGYDHDESGLHLTSDKNSVSGAEVTLSHNPLFIITLLAFATSLLIVLLAYARKTKPEVKV